MVTDQYIQEERERNARIESFISTIQKQGEVTLNFMENLKGRLKELDEDTQRVLLEIIEGVE